LLSWIANELCQFGLFVSGRRGYKWWHGMVFRWESGIKVAVGNYEPTFDFKYQSQLTCFIVFKVSVVTGGREL
jgi:hypothetical protein